MSSEQSVESCVQVHVRNVAGISKTEVSLTPGVTILAGRNATNRTSLLRAIMLGLGSNQAALKGDADEGFVELRVNGDTYTRTLGRRGGNVLFDGDPYLDDAEVADLFAFLLEDNEARRAVARGDELRELIMRPIDTESLDAEIERLQARREELDTELESIETAEHRLPELESRRNELQNEISEKRSELETTEATIESMDADVEETREERDELESKLDALRETRSELDDLRDRIEANTQSIDSLEAEREELTAERAALETDEEIDTADMQAELGRLRERKQTLESVVTELQNVVQFNEEMLTGERREVRSALSMESSDSVTDQLLDDQTICWTCGSEVSTDAIEATLSELRSFRRDKLDQIDTLDSEIEQLQGKLQSINARREQEQQLESRLSALDQELERRRTRVDELRDEQTAVKEELQQLEVAVEELEDAEFDEVLDKHRTANDLQYEIGRLETELDNVTSEVSEIESRLDERESLQSEREDVQSALVDARTRIEQIETQAVAEFNEHMETVLETLEYGNIDRIWIEQLEERVREGRQTVDRTVFELHIVRTNEEGRAYEDTVDHLSESEREVVGLVFALAGYLVHEVFETMPFIILDSLEAIDSERIAKLVDYFHEYADYSIVALLPEDERTLSDAHARLREI